MTKQQPREHVEKLGRNTRKLAYRTDNLLRSIVKPSLERLNNRNEQQAMRNPVYAEIENRRYNETHPDSSILLSDEAGLGWNEWRIQETILEETRSHPWWETTARYLNDRPCTKTVNRIAWAYQRLTRGWDDTATWSLDTYLTQTLGEQLQHLAATTHGYPGEPEYPEFEQWQQDLNINAQKLLAYANKWDWQETYDETGKPDLDAIQAKEEQLYQEAQEALLWVTNHLGHLWD